jgi:hypothetical protein
MEEFIQQLLHDAGVPADLDEQVKAQLAKDLTDRAADFINKRLVDSMDPKTLADFEAVIDKSPDDALAIQHFVESNVPNKEKITGLALVEFRALYLGNKA